MRLVGPDGHGLELRVAGYQFPDAEDERLRRSWLMIEGTARCPQGTWSFRWQALTSDEARLIPPWLRSIAERRRARDLDLGLDLDSTRPVVRFTEPNLALAADLSGTGDVLLRVGFDLEFSPPWHRRGRAGDPFWLDCRPTPEQVRAAAYEWEAETAPYPP